MCGGVRRAGNDSMAAVFGHDGTDGWVVGGRVGPDHAVVSDFRAGRIERCLVNASVEHFWIGALLGCANSGGIAGHDFADL